MATRRTGTGPARASGSGARGARRRRSRGSPTGARVLIALPWIAVALFAIYFDNGSLLPLLAIGLGIAGLAELYELLRPVRPVALAGFLSLVGIALAARYGDAFQIVVITAISVPLSFVLALVRPERRHVTLGIAATVLGVIWIGYPLAHAILLRELDHGDGLLIDVLIATFLGDTGAYFGGRLWGTRPLAPRISPGKTVEGLVIGILVGTLAFWFAGLYQDWLSGLDALLLGACVALAAPLGDLLESLVKRDIGVKDSGRFFGEHGGVLDRLDALFFTLVVGYYVAKALGY